MSNNYDNGTIMKWEGGAERSSEKGKPRPDLIYLPFLQELVNRIHLFNYTRTLYSLDELHNGIMDIVFRVIEHESIYIGFPSELYGLAAKAIYYSNYDYYQSLWSKQVEPKSYILLPPQVLLDMGTNLAYGAEKHDEHNWKEDMGNGRCYRALIRHTLQMLTHDESDPYPHYAAILFNIMVIFYNHDMNRAKI